MNRYKRLLALGLISVMLLSFGACGKKKSVEYNPLPEEDATVYNICVTQDEDNDYYNGISQGFRDAMSDLFGENHVTISDSIQSDTQLIFAVGPDSVTSAVDSTQETPIVGAGVMDYQHLLHLTAGVGDKWNKKTGTNLTGISSQPDIAAQLSLIIESTSDLRSVGLLYTPDDSDALYQLAILEKYLNQAGIPWKEYALPIEQSSESVSDDEALTDDDETTGERDEGKISQPAPSIIQKSKYVAPSITEGSNNTVEIFGETNLIDGIIAPNSAHSPMVSEFWTEDLSAANTETLSEDATLDEIITYASNECSALFLPTGSYLGDRLEDIVSIATDAGVSTISGDGSLGEKTLTCTYMDPYALGYSAGKKAYRILVNGDNPGELKITTPDVKVVKLYNKDIADKLGITFPKSFQEISEFKENYVIGSSTNRIAEEE
ncbi:MAG: ABC transporter substrate binding protein [Lachnospiraceae bacterium]|nr:ABC transporter substrate binding protein [Lachnospiraceae bacterium]